MVHCKTLVYQKRSDSRHTIISILKAVILKYRQVTLLTSWWLNGRTRMRIQHFWVLIHDFSSVTWQWPLWPQTSLGRFYDIYLKQNLIKYSTNLTFNISLKFLFPLKLSITLSSEFIQFWRIDSSRVGQ